MKGDYLNCYTLGRFAPSQEQLQYILPCDREQAIQLFALHIDEKQILMPRRQPLPVTVPHTRLAVCRLSSYAMATFLWRTGYLSHSTNLFVRVFERIIYERQLFRHLHLKESVLDEVVLELFHSSQGSVPCIDLPDPEIYPPDLLLARLHFSAIAPQQTILRIFIGWTETAPLGELDDLYKLLQQYMDLLHQVLLPGGSPTWPTENSLQEPAAYEEERPLPEPIAEPMVDWATDIVAPNAETATVETEYGEVSIPSADAEAPPPNWQIRETEGQDLLHSENGFQATKEDEDGYGQADSEIQTIPSPLEDELQLYRGLKPPRLYPKTLSNICIVAAERQRQIDAWGKIPKLASFKTPLLPSRNTRLKVPELFTHWYDVRYRWNVVTWLRHHSGHTEEEISDLLSYLQHHLAEKVWTVVSSARREEETNKNRRHHAREEKKSRDKGQNGSMK